MPVQIVIDHAGDTRYNFQIDDLRAIVEAEARFKQLTGKGFRAIETGKRGQPGRLLTEFDPGTEITVFVPPLQGG
jgi:hypothetical protein